MIKIDMKEIEGLFEKHDNQYEVLIDIYRIAFPDWDSIEAIDGSPTVSTKTWQDICGMFIEFDKEYHPTVLAGGIFLNRGFDSRPDMEDGMIDVSSLKVEYKKALSI
jgi:hypothetical protein